MAQTDVDNLCRDLGRLLSDMLELHKELAMHMQNKLDAIRQADSDRMQSITAREMVLADRIAEREGLRKQIARRIVAGLGRPSAQADKMKISELAALLAEPRRSQLLGLATGLREKIDQVEKLRITTTLITQEMLRHLGNVLSVMTSGGPREDIYRQTGQREQTRLPVVFEAVG